MCGICAKFDFDREANIARNLMTADAIVHRGLNPGVRNAIVGLRNPEI